METKTIPLEEIKIVGLSKRIANQDNQNALISINEAWNKFFELNLPGIISDQKNPGEIIAVYHEYETDYLGPYTLTLGFQVNRFENIPSGCVALTIASSKYQIFTAKGQMPDALGKNWQSIWNSPLERSYTYDFEVYDHRYHYPIDKEVDIYIGIR